MNSHVRTSLTSLVIGTTVIAAAAAVTAKSSDHRDFEGTVEHISTENIKVHGVEGGKAQTISFLITPKVTKLTHNHGKATAELREIHIGDMVKVTFDQKLLGVRHADAIVDETDGMHQKT